VVTKLDDLANPTPERFAEFLSLWTNNEPAAPNWVFAIKAEIRHVKHDGTTVTFVMKNGAVYVVTVQQTTQPLNPFNEHELSYTEEDEGD